jgi:hypothetical protein
MGFVFQNDCSRQQASSIFSIPADSKMVGCSMKNPTPGKGASGFVFRP